jgi:hypothetical protein
MQREGNEAAFYYISGVFSNGMKSIVRDAACPVSKTIVSDHLRITKK